MFMIAWSKRKLGEIYTERNERGDGSLPILSVSIHTGVSNGELDSGSLGKEVRRSEDKSLYKRVQPGDLIFNMMRAWQGAIGCTEIMGMVSPAYITAEPNGDVHPCFMDYAVRRTQTVAQIDSQSYGVTDFRKRLYWDSFIGITCELPSVPEQEKIADLLSRLDALIAANQRKADLLKQLKRAYLQRLFPAPGETVPRLRFLGFDDEWTKRTLGEVTVRVQGNDGRMDLATLTISAAGGWLDQRDRFSGNIAGNEQWNYTLLRRGQLSYNHGNSKLAKYGTVFELRDYDEALVPRVYHSFACSEAATPAFIETLFASGIPDAELAKLVSSGARMDGLLNINFNDFMGIEITLPRFGEQIRIGGFFRALDALITTQIGRVAGLERVKHAYLRQMFV